MHDRRRHKNTSFEHLSGLSFRSRLAAIALPGARLSWVMPGLLCSDWLQLCVTTAGLYIPDLGEANVCNE